METTDADRPYQLPSFRRNIRRAKFALGYSLFAALSSGVGHLVLLHRHGNGHHGRHDKTIEADGGWIGAARWWTDVAILFLTVSLRP
jgi:hypothetical protein